MSFRDCLVCDGTGRDPVRDDARCPHCQGRGTIPCELVSLRDEDDGFLSTAEALVWWADHFCEDGDL